MYTLGEWSLFDFVDPPRHLALRAADRVQDDQEPDVLKIHLEQFLLPALPTDPAVYLSPLSFTGGSCVAAPEKKPTRVKITGRKYIATSATPSSAGGAIFTRGDTSTTTEVTSPTHVMKKRKFVAPTLTAFEAVQAAYALPFGITSGAQEGVTSTSLPSMGVALPTGGSGSLLELISHAGVTSAASCAMPPPMLIAAVTVTASPISTPLTFSVAPSSFRVPCSRGN
ncbi:hypothetical protein Hanom_Chr07g00649911 [Helianthus anomalus]